VVLDKTSQQPLHLAKVVIDVKIAGLLSGKRKGPFDLHLRNFSHNSLPKSRRHQEL
jgi:hypothetical protein